LHRDKKRGGHGRTRGGGHRNKRRGENEDTV